ncbi:MAG: hypothetical protein ACRC5T_09045 [Cetobacterium sp.]
MKIQNKKKYIISIEIVLSLLIAYSILKLCQRSVWVDEGMLLKSLLNIEKYSDFFRPLPYYDQAQPVLASFVMKLIIALISKNYFYIRISYFLFLTLSLFFFHYSIKSDFKKNNKIISLLIAGASISIWGFYFTEIKHYALEMLASFFLVGILYYYHKTENEIKTLFFLIATLPLGFSNIIPTGIMFGYVSLVILYKNRKFSLKYIIISILLFFIMLIIYFHMKYLTIYQLNNYDVYFSKGLIFDIKELIISVVGAYGKGIFLISAFSSLVAFFSDKKSFLFKLNLYFIITSIIILILKTLGIYPVVYSRHIVWIVPFSLVIINLTLDFLKEKKNNFTKIIFYFLIILLTLLFFRNFNRKIEYTDNNNLYLNVSKLKPSNIVVLPNSQPSLEYYLEIYPELKKHNFIYSDRSISQKKELNKDYFSIYLDKNFKLNNFNEFYLLNSHITSLLDKKLSERAEMVVKYLTDNNYIYEIVFTSNNVELLKINK